jgi:hypothetical protein
VYVLVRKREIFHRLRDLTFESATSAHPAAKAAEDESSGLAS